MYVEVRDAEPGAIHAGWAFNIADVICAGAQRRRPAHFGVWIVFFFFFFSWSATLLADPLVQLQLRSVALYSRSDLSRFAAPLR